MQRQSARTRAFDIVGISVSTSSGAGVDVRTIAGRLGHADPAITLRTYAHFLEAADRQAAEVMGRLELGAPPSP